MKIAILNITGGGISGGYRTYLNELIPRIVSHSDISALMVALPEHADFHALQQKYPAVEWAKMKTTRFSLSGVDKGTKKITKKFNPDVIYIPTARFWTFNNIPIVNMNQNMEPYIPIIPENPLSEKIRLYLLKKEGSRAFRKANKVIAISDFVKDTLVNGLCIDKSNIAVIYHGHDQIEKDISHTKPPSIPQEWANDFIFTVGLIRPARGLHDVIGALKLLKNKGILVNLVIAGETLSNMTKFRRDLEGYIDHNDLAKNIIWTGHLTHGQMNWCYHNCKIFAMTSRVEACSIIALESLSHGCAIIAANNPPLTEIYPDSTIFYSPGNDADMADKIEGLLKASDDDLTLIRQRALVRSKAFMWETCAALTIKVLLKAAQKT